MKVRLSHESERSDVTVWELPTWEPLKCLTEISSKPMRGDQAEQADQADGDTRQKAEETSSAVLSDYEEVEVEVAAIRDAKWISADRLAARNDTATGTRGSSPWKGFFKTLRTFVRPGTAKGYRRIEWTCVSQSTDRWSRTTPSDLRSTSAAMICTEITRTKTQMR